MKQSRESLETEIGLFQLPTHLFWMEPRYRNQRNVYNGHHQVHCMRFQAVVAPDVMIVDLFGPITGRRHDSYVLDESCFNKTFAEAQQGQPVQHKYYVDKGYFVRSHAYAAYKGKKLPQILSDENNMMAKQRVGVERTFGSISSRWVDTEFYKEK